MKCSDFILMLILPLHGCASLVSGTEQYVNFQSTPEQVVVTVKRFVKGDEDTKPFVEERVVGKTPISHRLEKDKWEQITFAKEGYKPLTMPLTKTLDGWFWGNIVFGGFFGSTTDSMTGAMNEYSPGQYYVTLVPEIGSSVENPVVKAQRDKAREFIMTHYANLLQNIAQQGGPELNTLLVLLNADGPKEAEALRKIRALSEVYGNNPAEFAQRVTELYLK